jgi:hypothetical protein
VHLNNSREAGSDKNFVGITLFVVRDWNSVLLGASAFQKVKRKCKEAAKFVPQRKLMELVSGRREVETTNNYTNKILVRSTQVCLLNLRFLF